MIAPDGTVFNINQCGKLYYVNSINTSVAKVHTLEEWHSIIGHCNKKGYFESRKSCEWNENLQQNIFLLSYFRKRKNRRNVKS